MGGLGRVSDILLTEDRAYNPQNGELVKIGFEQKASTGTVQVKGKRDGKELVLNG